MCYLFAQILIYVSVLALPRCPLFNLWKVIFCHIIASAHSQTNWPSHKNTRHNKPYIHTKCNHNTISFVPFKQRYRNLLEELQISSSFITSRSTLCHSHLQSWCYSQVWTMTHNSSYLSTHSSAVQHHSWYTQETFVLDESENLLAGGSWPTLDNSSRLNRHTWSASEPSAATMGVWCIDPYWTSPSAGLAWPLFRWLLHMLSSLNWCPITLHLMCLLPKTKHSLILSCGAVWTGAAVRRQTESEGWWGKHANIDYVRFRCGLGVCWCGLRWGFHISVHRFLACKAMATTSCLVSGFSLRFIFGRVKYFYILFYYVYYATAKSNKTHAWIDGGKCFTQNCLIFNTPITRMVQPGLNI